ncbi:MAG: hypothetical protein U0228_00910 [Myxococcaceae bacterium]
MGLFDFWKKKPAPSDSPKEAAPVEPYAIGPVPAGLRRIEVVRARNGRSAAQWNYQRTLELDGASVRESTANNVGGVERLFERFATDFPSDAEARTSFDSQVALLSRNFPFVTRHDRDVPLPKWKAGAVPFTSHPELEAALDSARDDAGFEAAARVYTDWLVGQGDPRGEIFSLAGQLRWDDLRAFDDANARVVWGALDSTLGAEVHSLEWRSGILVGASLKRRTIDSPWGLVDVTQAFLAHPLARFVTRLRFGLENYEGDNDWGRVLKTLGESGRAHALRSLRFDDYGSEDSELSWTNYGDLQDGWSKLSGLEELVLRAGGDGNLGALELPNLRKFVRETGGLRSHELTDITRAKWPKLEHLEVWFGEPGAYGGDCTPDQAWKFVQDGVPPTVTTLALKNCSFLGALLPRLITWPGLSRLRTLDLSLGTLGDTEAAVLLASTAELKHLERLDLRENGLSAARVAELKAALPNAVLDDQREANTRYVAVGE